LDLLVNGKRSYRVEGEFAAYPDIDLFIVWMYLANPDTPSCPSFHTAETPTENNIPEPPYSKFET
jgi:hypothetical protein